MTRPFLLLFPLLLAAPVAAQPDSAAAASATPDGQSVSLDRFLNRQSERFMAADTDGDGRIGKAELAAVPRRGGRDPARRFDRMDVDHDGFVDRSEVRAALTRRFRRMDRNGDGLLSGEERVARRGKRAGAANGTPPQP